MSRAYLLKFPCHQKHLSYYEASIMAATKSSHRPPDKRIRNSQPTNYLRIIVHFQDLLQNMTICYYNSRQLGLLQFTTACYYNLR